MLVQAHENRVGRVTAACQALAYLPNQHAHADWAIHASHLASILHYGRDDACEGSEEVSVRGTEGAEWRGVVWRGMECREIDKGRNARVVPLNYNVGYILSAFPHLHGDVLR